MYYPKSPSLSALHVAYLDYIGLAINCGHTPHHTKDPMQSRCCVALVSLVETFADLPSRPSEEILVILKFAPVFDLTL